MRPKRLVVISDLHCGHIVGLTPPQWDTDRPKPHLKKSYAMRRIIWDAYSTWVKELRPIDILLVNGDCIDGRNEGRGSTELLYVDRNDQVEMAVDCIQEAKAKQIVMAYGTGYHTGMEEDFERPIADRVNALKIGSVDAIDVNGLVINYRHFISGSQVPHGRHTTTARERVWNTLWALRGEYPLAQIVIRSHVHYFDFCGDGTGLALTTPALEGYGSKYGARLLSGLVDIGLVFFDITDKETWTWDKRLLRLPKTEAIRV
jgi:hypothetical protein